MQGSKTGPRGPRMVDILLIIRTRRNGVLHAQTLNADGRPPDILGPPEASGAEVCDAG